MNRPKFLLYSLGFLVLGVGIVWAGQTTLTTYYPAPTGNYNQLTSNYVSIGTSTMGQALVVMPAAGENGNVGIGSTNPGYALDVTRASGAVADLGLTSGSSANSTSNVSRIELNNWYGGSESTSEIVYDFYGSYYTTGTSHGLSLKSGRAIGFSNIWFRDANSGIMGAFRDTGYSATPTLVSTSNFLVGGNVGIGTTAPSAPLEISYNTGSATEAPLLRLNSVNGNTGNAGSILWTNNSDTNLMAKIYGSDSGNWGGDLIFATKTNTGSSSGSPSEKMRVNNAGNVGIGTTSPAQKLDVSGIVKIEGSGTFNSTSNGLSLYSGNDSYKIGFDNLGGTVGYIRYNIDNADSVHGHIFSFGSPGSPTNVMIVRGDGNVGIGLTGPRAKLEVSGDIWQSWGNNFIGTVYSDGSQYRLGIMTNANSRDTQIWSQGADGSGVSGITFYTGATPSERMRVDKNGNVGIGTTSPVTPLHVAAGATDILKLQSTTGGAGNHSYIDFQTNGGTDVMGRIGAIDMGSCNGSLVFEVNNNSSCNITTAEAMRITNAGNVGIGQTSPDEFLSVGTGNVSSNMDLAPGYAHFGSDYSAWTTIIGQNVRARHGANSGMELATSYTGGGASAIRLYFNSIEFDTASASAISGYGAGTAFSFPRMTIDQNGNVGIGAVSPAGPLQVMGSTGFDGSNSSYFTNNAYIYGRTDVILTGRLDGGNDAWSFGTGARNALVFNTNLGGAQGAVGTSEYSIQLEGNSESLGFLSAAKGSSPVMVLTQGGYVGIGNTSPSYPLDISGSGLRVGGGGPGTIYLYGSTVYDTGNYLHLGTPNAYADGNIYAAGIITAASDQRLKQNIKPLIGTLSKLDQLRGVSFEWNHLSATSMRHKEGEKGIGMIAQELQKVYPELVTGSKKNYLGINYGAFTAVLLQSIKELKKEKDKEIKDQQKEIQKLQDDNEQLRARMDTLEKKVRVGK